MYKRCDACGLPRDNSHKSLCPICRLNEMLSAREADMAGQSGMMQEFARAKTRASRLPRGSRPVVTTTSTITRASAIRTARLEDTDPKVRDSNYGIDPSKWWIFKAGQGEWLVIAPTNAGHFCVHKFPSGAAILAAFAQG